MLTTQQALQRMKADIQLRGLSKNTFNSYLTHAEMFLKYCNRPIEELTEMDVRRFLGHLVVERKLTPGTVNSYSAAIRFFFAVTLNRTMNYLQIPRVKVPKKLPVILTRDEVAELINNCLNIKHKALILLAYGSGLRVGELASLKVKAIESDSMRVLIRGGKGKKDRYTILSQNSLFALRDYWRKYRPKSPEGFLFPGLKNIGHITDDAIGQAICKTLARTNISKNVTPHTLRHCFATHLLEDGLSLLQIKELMGHANISSTTVYLHLANTTSGVTSPADNIPAKFEDYPLC
jgi:site-specific recombinase XerD